MGRKLVDMIWIHHRMRLKDARREAELRRRLPRLAPEVVPFVEITIVPATDPNAPVVDVTIARKQGGEV